MNRYGHINNISQELLRTFYGELEREVRAYIKRTKTPRLYLYIATDSEGIKFETIREQANGSMQVRISGFYEVRSTIPKKFRPKLP